MEENQSILGMEVDPQGRSNLSEIGRWGRFLAIVCFIFLALFLLILAFSWGSVITQFYQLQTGIISESIAGSYLVVASVLMLIVLGIWALLAFFLYRAGTRIISGLRDNSQVTFNSGLLNLRNFFVLFGVINLLRVVFSLVNLI